MTSLGGKEKKHWPEIGSWNKWNQVIIDNYSASIHKSFLLRQLFNPFVSNAPFFASWKHQKTVSFSHVFRGERKEALGTNGLKLITTYPVQTTLKLKMIFLKFSLVITCF